MSRFIGGGHFGTARSIRLSVRPSVPWHSCLGYRHAGCLQLSQRRTPETCGLRTRPRTDVDHCDFCHRRPAIDISSRHPRGDILFDQQWYAFVWATRDGHGLGPSMGWVGLGRIFQHMWWVGLGWMRSTVMFLLQFVLVIILCTKKICK